MSWWLTVSTVQPRTKFGQALRHELDSRGMSLRKLSKLLQPDRPDIAKRNLSRWIGGYNDPSRLSRIAVARALGLPDDHFLGDEDDEEEDPIVALMSAIRLVVQAELKAQA